MQVTRKGPATVPFESPDGKFIYYRKADGPGIWRVPAGGGQEVAVVETFDVGWGNWAIVDDGIYFMKRDSKVGVTIEFYNFATQRINQLAALGQIKTWVHGMAVSPDRQWILYTQVDPGNTTNITMVENFR